MPRPVPSFPFPQRSNAMIWEILYSDFHPTHTQPYQAMYARSQGDEAKLWRFQYMGIEEELERSFRYVHPSDDNAGCFSLRFAEIIRSAANAYEILAKELYAKLYNRIDKLNVFNYLALDLFLTLTDQRVTQLAGVGTFPTHPEVTRPFANLASWDKASPIQPAHIPDWWNAYNAVKHSQAGLKDYATLANAMAVTAALFLLIERIFGFGVLQGGTYEIERTQQGTGHSIKFRTFPTWARLFVRI